MSEHALDQMLDWEDESYQEEDPRYEDGDRAHDQAKLSKALQEAKMNADRFKVSKESWEDKLSEVEKVEGGKYLFPEKGNTVVRILLYPERNAIEFSEEVVTTYFDKPRTRYMFPVLVADDEDQFNYEVKLAVVAKTVYQEILKFLAAGYDFMHPEEGHAAIIVRSGEGLNTKYSVIPSKAPVPIDYKYIEFEGTLSSVAQEFVNKVDQDREAKEQDGDFSF